MKGLYWLKLMRGGGWFIYYSIHGDLKNIFLWLSMKTKIWQPTVFTSPKYVPHGLERCVGYRIIYDFNHHAGLKSGKKHFLAAIQSHWSINVQSGMLVTLKPAGFVQFRLVCSWFNVNHCFSPSHNVSLWNIDYMILCGSLEQIFPLFHLSDVSHNFQLHGFNVFVKGARPKTHIPAVKI